MVLNLRGTGTPTKYRSRGLRLTHTARSPAYKGDAAPPLAFGTLGPGSDRRAGGFYRRDGKASAEGSTSNSLQGSTVPFAIFARNGNARSFSTFVLCATATRLAVCEFIEGWYNPHRRHSALDYLSPIAYEEGHIVR